MSVNSSPQWDNPGGGSLEIFLILLIITDKLQIVPRDHFYLQGFVIWALLLDGGRWYGASLIQLTCKRNIIFPAEIMNQVFILIALRF